MTNIELTPASLALFLAYAKDAGNWNGTPLIGGNVGGSKADRGNLTDLKRKGLITTFSDERLDWVSFTDTGIAFAAEQGVTIHHSPMNETPLKLSAPKTVTTKREKRWFVDPTTPGKTPVIIPAGTKVQVCFIEGRHDRLFVVHESGQRMLSVLALAHESFTGFSKPPGLRTLEKYTDCIAKTPTGHKTEPDGHGPDGSPSWLLVLGLI